VSENSFVEVTTQSWGSRIMGSLWGALFGVLLFLLSFVVLWMNEGRTDISRIAEKSLPVNASTVDSAAEGKFVAISGVLESSEKLGDPSYLAEGSYLALNRSVEMYAWVEHTKSEKKKNTGGSETTTTEYTYEIEWTSRPASSSSFKEPAGHENPQLTIEDASYKVKTAQIGAYTIEPSRISLPSAKQLSLTSEMVLDKKGTVEGNNIYLGKGTPAQPQVGDIRISYTALPNSINVTGFGEQQGSSLVPYTEGDSQLYTVYQDTRDGAIASMRSAHKTTGWILRVVGFLMMWFGLSMVLGPISTMLDVLPFLGNVSRTMLNLITFVIAAILSVITIIISILLHSIIFLTLLVLILVGGGGFYIYQQYQAKEKPVLA
jgi:hypothetical protein